MDYREIISKTNDILKYNYKKTMAEATSMQLHNALSQAVMIKISDDWIESNNKHSNQRRAYYFSAEYLIGRMVFNNLYCLGILDEVRECLIQKGVDITILEDIEDAALGNGGLGRLAACFLDSAATHEMPLDGYGLRYKFGLFKQSFEDGLQIETADNWQQGGDPWSRRCDDESVVVEFAGQAVMAVPFDMPVIGYKTNNIGTLRLWQSEPLQELDFSAFNDQDYEAALCEKNTAEDITGVLYPNDSTFVGKCLRLKQQYFLCSASLQDILRRYKSTHENNLDGFPLHCAIQLNDTHPTLSIPELIRLLIKEGMNFDGAFEIAKKTFSYTNHTVMSEALEKWDVSIINSILPNIGQIISQINKKLCEELKRLSVAKDIIKVMRIIDKNLIHMARLAVYVSTYVNGVAQIHSEILKKNVFKEWYMLYPDKFQNKTNGITQRRWLGLCNPELTAMITERIGDGFLTDLIKIEGLKEHIDDTTIDCFNEIKSIKKKQLSRMILQKEGIKLSSDFVYDIQVKRLHEYKRQLLNAFSIMYLYFGLKEGSIRDFTPTAYIFGAKAAPGYIRAKAIIKFINEIAKLVNADSDTKDKIQVIFIQNYNCSYAEHIIPAADISEQISPAGTEASGTGNMKFMLNGAVTLGTYDGANIEIAEQAGAENNYIFGARAEELARIKESYNPQEIYSSNTKIKRVIDTLINGTVNDNGLGWFNELYNSLLHGASWHQADHYFLLKDMSEYVEAKLKANREYIDRRMFGKKCLANISSAGKFSSDRTISQYAKDIWHI